MSEVRIDSYVTPEEIGDKLLSIALDIENDIVSKHPDLPISIVRDIVSHTFLRFAWHIHELVKAGDEDEGPPTLIQ